jgi:hypothetical protein
MKGDLCILTAREDGKLKALLPLTRRRNALYSLCEHKTDSNFYYLADKQVIPPLMNYWASNGIQEVLLTNVLADGDLFDDNWSVIKRSVCPILSLEPDWQNGIAKKIRKNVAYTERHLSKEGKIDHNFFPPEPNRMMQLFEMNKKWWEKRGFPGIAATEKELSFFHDVANTLSPSIIFSTLTLNDAPISHLLFFRREKTLMYYAGGHSQEHTSCSIGALHLLTAMRRAQADFGTHGLDFLRGNEGYKQDFGAINSYEVFDLKFKLPSIPQMQPSGVEWLEVRP